MIQDLRFKLHRSGGFGFAFVLLLVCLAALPAAGFAQVFDDREQNLVAGLRSRGMFDLAELHCVESLRREGLTAVDYASIAIERIKVQTSAARAQENGNQLWRGVDQIAEDFQSAHPDNPRSVLVMLQQALAHISFADAIEREVAAKSAANARRELGLEELRSARSILDRGRRKADGLLKQVANVSRTDAMLSSKQLRSLITSFDYQLAIVNLSSAKLSTGGSESERLDRIDSLSRVLKQLAAVRTTVARSRSLWWQTWINEATCRRMMGDLKSAEKIIDSMENEQRPSSTDETLLQEQIEFAIATGDTQRMQSLAKNAKRLPSIGVESQIALIRLFVAAGQVQEASEIAETVTARANPWWTRRADLALLSGGTSVPKVATSDAETRLLLQAAQKAEGAGDLDAALKGYLAVARSQFSSGDRAGGLNTTFSAAKLLEKKGNNKEAAKVYFEPAKAYRSEKIASSLHLRGCWNLSQARSDSFDDELDFHIRSWPGSETANQARYWLGSDRVSKKQYADAFETLLGVDSRSVHFLPAVKLARYAGRKQLLDIELRGAASRPAATRMLQGWIDAFVASEDVLQPQVAMAIAMAELAFVFEAESESESKKRLLSLAKLPSAKSDAEFLYWLAIASDSSKYAHQANQLSFDETMARQVLASLDRIKTSNSRSEIRLLIANDVIADSTNAKVRDQVTLVKAKAMAELGNRKEAISVLENLISTNPRNLSAKLALARLLRGTEALSQWRTIAGQTAPQSEAWFEAKYNVARGLVDSGKESEAAKILRYIKAVPPGWENSKLRREFEDLLGSIED